MSKNVAECAAEPCAACPWRVSNAGKQSPTVDGHKYGWYDVRNQRRLWKGLKRAEVMTCHPTDHTMSQANGKFISAGIQTRECTGAVILIQRELMTAQSRPVKLYRGARPFGMTKTGLRVLLERALFGVITGTPLGRPDLNNEDVQCEVLGRWSDGGYR